MASRPRDAKSTFSGVIDESFERYVIYDILKTVL